MAHAINERVARWLDYLPEEARVLREFAGSGQSEREERAVFPRAQRPQLTRANVTGMPAAHAQPSLTEATNVVPP